MLDLDHPRWEKEEGSNDYYDKVEAYFSFLFFQLTGSGGH